MSQYLLLLRGGDFEKYSPQEMEQIVQKYVAWGDQLRKQGVYKQGQELNPGGRVLSMQGSKLVDGPYAESKEGIGGFYWISAENYDRAVEIARACPHLTFNGVVELREINYRA